MLTTPAGWPSAGTAGWSSGAWPVGDPAAGLRPTLFIHERCARLVECLPMLQHDPHRPEDVLKVDCDDDGLGGDDAGDCLRYLVGTRARKVIEMKLRGF
jgi:hypothetical protein